MKNKELRIVSGGQSGVDRAALDVALHLGIPCGGWCPKGRLAEDGPIPEEYPMEETPLASYEQRTLWNVRDSDATVILAPSVPLSGGTHYTQTVAEGLHKPCLVIVLDADTSLVVTTDWLRRHHVCVLNVAGPRESGSPGIHERAASFLTGMLRLYMRSGVDLNVTSGQKLEDIP
jgi:hypothetical protein